MRCCHRSSDGSVEVRGSIESEWLRARGAKLVGNVFEFVQVVRLQLDLQRRTITHSSIQVERSLRQAKIAVGQGDRFGCVRVARMNHAIERNWSGVSRSRRNGRLYGCIRLCREIVEGASPGGIGIGIHSAVERDIFESR